MLSPRWQQRGFTYYSIKLRNTAPQGFRRQYILDIPYYKISCLGFTDSPIRFHLALERPCYWKHIVISNWLPWNNLPCFPSHKTLDFLIHCLEVFIRVFIAIKIPIMDHIDLTCNLTNIPLYAAHRKNCCRIFLLPFIKPPMGNTPNLIVLSIYVGVSGSWPRDLDSIRWFHIKFWWNIHMIFCSISSINNRISSLSTML